MFIRHYRKTMKCKVCDFWHRRRTYERVCVRVFVVWISRGIHYDRPFYEQPSVRWNLTITIRYSLKMAAQSAETRWSDDYYVNCDNLSSSSISTTARYGLWPVKQCPAIFSYLLPTLSISSLLALEDPFLPLLSISSWVFPFFSASPVLD